MSSPEPMPGMTAWQGTQLRFWVITISVLALVATAFSMVAIVISHPRDTKVVATANAGGSVASAPGQAIDFTADPDPSFKARDPKAPVTPTGTVHRVELHAIEKVLEIAPGVKQIMWTFGGTVPGPILRGRVGDTFEITLVNDAKNTNSHSIDFHASKVAWNVEMRSIAPGEKLVYRFTAKHSGIFMYHCGTPPVLHHIANGMYGAVIIDPPNLPPVDHEFVMLQSEALPHPLPLGQVADLNKMLNESSGTPSCSTAM